MGTEDDRWEEIARAFESTEKLLHKMYSAQKVSEEKQARLQQDVDQLLKIVRDGNGSPPIVQRLLVLEGKQETTQNTLKDFDQAKTDQKKHAKSVNLALLVGGMGFVTSIFTAIIKLWS